MHASPKQEVTPKKERPGIQETKGIQGKRNSRAMMLQQVETAIHIDQKRTEGTRKTLRKSQTDELSIIFDMQEIILRGVS